MPFAGKWSARIRQPGQFDRIRTELDAFGEGIDVVWGIKDEETFVQAIRFDSDEFDRSDVTEWLGEHNDTQTGEPYHVISIEAPLKEADTKADGQYNCECLDCGHEVSTDEHCRDKPCPECGGQMRRVERPGPGQRASIDPVVAFSMAGSWTPVGAQEIRDGAVHQRFKKELIRVGEYEQSGGGGFEVTLKDIDNWIKVSKKMHSNGVRIPVTAGPVPHEDVGNPQNSIGTMEDEFVEGDGLYVILDLVGEDNIENALANDVSIFSPIEFTDGKGRVYEQPITHVAITPNPLVPGLEGWEIAASLKTSGKGKEIGMWKKIMKALGLDMEGATEENAESKILAGIKEIQKTHKDELKEAKKAKKASLEDEGVKELVDAEVEKQTKVIKASFGKERPDADPMTVDVVADNRGLKLNGLFEGCRITADVQKDITERYGKKETIAASMKAGENSDEFNFWMGILAKNSPVELTEKTGAQVIAASLPKPEATIKDEDNPLLADADRRAEMAKK